MKSSKMKHNEKGSTSFTFGALLLLASGILVKIIGALFKIPLSNLLGDTGFGYFSAAYDVFSPFYALAMGGLPVAAARLIATENSSDGQAVGRERQMHRVFIWLGIIFTLAFLAAIPLLSRILSQGGQTTLSLLAIAPSVFLFFVISAYRGSFEGRHDMKPTAVSDIIEACGKLGLGLLFVLLVARLTENGARQSAAALFGITVGVVIAALYLFLKRPRLPKGQPSDLSNRRLLDLVWRPALTALLISSAVGLIDALTVAPVLHRSGIEASAALYGLRSKAHTLYNLVPSVSAMLGIGAVPALAVALKQGNRESLQKQTSQLLKLTATLVFPIGFGMAAISKPIMCLLYSGEASAVIGARLLTVYGFAAVFAGLCVPIIHALQALDHQKSALRVLLFGVAVKLIANVVLISVPKIGIVGAAWGTLLCYLFVFAIGLSLLCSAVGFRKMPALFFRPLLAAFVCSAVSTVALAGNSKLLTMAAILLAGGVYLLLIVVLRVFSREDLAELLRKNETKNE
ncbi:MAG: polysaccharide biosynthesis C-terminal domain-containing protein [Clostridia bacterium]|nr:polysaccharide biosynthesis C-terminal domain-containing protein [Clostridia bacterium]